MTPDQTTRASKFLSLVLRHEPEAAHVSLEAAGWTDVETLLAGCAKAGKPLSRAELEHVVATNAKKRFEFNADGKRIRAEMHAAGYAFFRSTNGVWLVEHVPPHFIDFP